MPWCLALGVSSALSLVTQPSAWLLARVSQGPLPALAVARRVKSEAKGMAVGAVMGGHLQGSGTQVPGEQWRDGEGSEGAEEKGAVVLASASSSWYSGLGALGAVHPPPRTVMKMTWSELYKALGVAAGMW